MSSETTIDVKALLDETNRNQRIAASPVTSIWASANAGAGKTKVLIDRIARLLLAGSDPSKILAVTYTRAAAAEMTTRLFKTLGEWAVADDETLKERLIKLNPELRFDDIEAAQKLLSQARRLFARALETPGGLKIETIHAFCGNILKRFPLEAGIAPNFEVIEDSDNQRLQAKAIEIASARHVDTFNALSEIIYESDLTASLLQMHSKIGNIGLKNYEAQLIKTLNLTKNKLDFDAAIKDALGEIDFRNAKKCISILLNEGGSNDEKTAQKIADALNLEGQDKLIRLLGIVLSSTGGIRAKAPVAKKLLDNPNIGQLFGDGSAFPLGELEGFWHKAEVAQYVKVYHESMLLARAADEFGRVYDSLKEQTAKLDFGDLLRKTSELFNRDDGSALWVLYKMDQGLQHVLIDESQDTSAEQWDLLNPLLNALEAGERDYARTRFVVGDDKQSIYSFQGASPERYLLERQKFSEINNIGDVEFKDVKFNMSFRTGQNILNTVDAVWKHLNSNNSGTNDGGTGDGGNETKFLQSNHYSAREGQAGQVEIYDIEMGEDDSDEGDNAWDIPLDSIRESSPVNQLADKIAKEIKRRIDMGYLIHVNSDTVRPLEAKDVMILVKTRKALFHQIIKRLKHYNIPVAGSDLIIIKEDPAVMDLVALGRFALRPEDDFNLACVLKGVFCNLYDDDKHLFPLAYGRFPKTLWQVLRDSEDETFANAKEFLFDISAIGPTLTPFEFLTYVLEKRINNGKTGWESLISRLGHESKEAVEVLLDIAIKADSLGVGNLMAFLNMVELESGSQKRDFDDHSEGVKVMTVHGAKGREAPMVILPDTTRAIGGRVGPIYFSEIAQIPLFIKSPLFSFALLDSLKDEAQSKARAEDSRLLYVAMTRARDLLMICGYKFRNRADKNSWYKSIEDCFDGKNTFKTDKNDGHKVLGHEPKVTKTTKVLPIGTNSSVVNIEVPDWANQEPQRANPPPKMIAPSALFEEDEEPPVISPLKGGVKGQYLRGQLIHSLLEALPNIAPEDRQEQARRRLLAHNITNELRDDVINQALKIIDDKRFKTLFGENSRAEVAIVGKGKNLNPNIVVNGLIDRLVINDDEILVLDYKTNRPPPKDKSGIPKVYVKQLAAYRAVLQNRYPDKKVTCAILWTDIPLMMEVDDNVLDEIVTKIKQF